MSEGELRAWLEAEAAARRFSGVVLAWRGGAPFFEHATGLAHRGHRVPNTIGTRFQVASVTKMITATAALILVERGGVGLHQPLTEVLPPEHRPAAMKQGHTLHHLLSHTSGLANYHDDDDQTWASFTSCWERVPVWAIRRPADMLPLFADLPAEAEPGARLKYGDANFVLAGLVIEAVTASPYAEAVSELVLGPADMGATGFFDLDREPDAMATGYLLEDPPAGTPRSNIYSVPARGMPDGGMVTTAADLARFLDSLAAAELVSAPMVAEMLSPRGLIRDDLEAYGYGMELFVDDGATTIYGHAGGDPGVSAMVSHYVGDAVTTVVLCNIDRGSWAACQQVASALGIREPRV